MDPFTIALATFGVQKLRGKSTSRALRDAALFAGGAQLAGMGGIGGFTPFGSAATPGAIQGLSQTGIANLLGMGSTPVLKEAAVQGAIPTLSADAAGASGTLGTTGFGVPTSGFEYTATQLPSTPTSTGFFGKVGELYGKLGPAEKIGLGVAGASLLGGEEEPQEPIPGTTQAERDAAQVAANEQIGGLTAARGTMPTYSGSPYDYNSNFYRFNTGGIVSVLPKFSIGGINYLPSKQTHDENDVHNYVRATGYVEDGSGNGDKDEDTILAQLADGEFVSRADAILGAGIMEGASPSSMKDMRKKGAAFFYDQQSKFKRVYDLLNASRKDN
jgi:hypothetical protein